MKHFQLWSVEIFFLGFYYVYLALKKWYFCWDCEWAREKRKRKKNQRFIEIAPLISFSQFTIQITQISIKIIIHIEVQKLLYSYEEIAIHLEENPAGLLLLWGEVWPWNVFVVLGTWVPCVQLTSESLRFWISRLEMLSLNYIILHSQAAHWPGCRFESTQSKLNRGLFCLPLNKFKGWLTGELVLGVNNCCLR